MTNDDEDLQRRRGPFYTPRPDEGGVRTACAISARGSFRTPRPDEGRVASAVAADARWAGVLALDVLDDEVRCLRPAPWDGRGAAPRRWLELDDARFVGWLRGAYGARVSAAAAARIARAVAERRPYSPVASYLGALRWDGRPRAESWLSRYFGAPVGRRSGLLGSHFLVGAAARALRPGGPAPPVLAFCGPQGSGKSAALAALGGEWYKQGYLRRVGRDELLTLRGAWIFEVTDLSGRTTLKMEGFLQAKSDIYRPPYERAAREFPRQVAFAVTSQDPPASEVVSPDWVPYGVCRVRTAPADVPALARDRDQLWAEAVHLLRSGAGRWRRWLRDVS